MECLETVKELLTMFHPNTLVDLCTPQFRIIEKNIETRKRDDMILNCHPTNWKWNQEKETLEIDL